MPFNGVVFCQTGGGNRTQNVPSPPRFHLFLYKTFVTYPFQFKNPAIHLCFDCVVSFERYIRRFPILSSKNGTTV